MEAMLMIFPRRWAIIALPTAWQKTNACEIGFNDFVAMLREHLFHRSDPGSACIVDKHVDAAKCGQAGIDHTVNVGGILDAAAQCERFHSEFLQLLRGLCTTVFFAGAKDQVRAPISARRSAIWRPSPTEPPVMMAVRPVRSKKSRADLGEAERPLVINAGTDEEDSPVSLFRSFFVR